MKKLLCIAILASSSILGAELTIDQKVARLEQQVRVLQSQVRVLGKGVTNTVQSARTKNLPKTPPATKAPVSPK